MMRNEYIYTAEGKYRNLTVTVQCRTYETALRAAKNIIKENEKITTAVVKDRKGNTLKVIAE